MTIETFKKAETLIESIRITNCYFIRARGFIGMDKDKYLLEAQMKIIDFAEEVLLQTIKDLESELELL